MHRLGTKERHERETEEVERLVRPSPKVKPPRHDKRRERVEADPDPDLDGEDRDLSKNYKVIGGSDTSGPKKDLITVRLKADPSQVVHVSEETLRENPSKYEKIEADEAAKSDEGKGDESEGHGKEDEGSKDEGQSPEADVRAQSSLREMADADPQFKMILTDFLDPKSQMFQLTEGNPGMAVGKFLGGRTPPKGVNTLGDLRRVLTFKGPEGAPVGKRLPKPKKDKPGAPSEGKSRVKRREPEPLKPAPGQPTRRVSQAETARAEHTITMTFPPRVAVTLMLQKPPLHPDEVDALVADYHVARTIPTPSAKIGELRDKAAKFYTMNPAQVPPPKTVKTVTGNVPLVDLPKEEQATAIRKHQIRTVAMSIAARAAIAQSLEQKTGAPEDLASVLTDFMLSGRGETPDARQQRSAQLAERLFYRGLEKNPVKLADSVAARVLRAIDDPGAKRAAVGFFQAQDYHAARERFLDPDAEEFISERQTPEEIGFGLSKAAAFLRAKASRYPDGTYDDPATPFRMRILRHIGALVPEKMGAIQETLDKDDNTYYDTLVRRYEQAKKAYKRETRRAEAEARKEYDAYSERQGQSPEGDIELPPGSDEILMKWGVVAPKEPVKPPRYDTLRKGPSELGAAAQDLWDEFTSRTASQRTLSARVADRYLFGPFSTYSVTSAMGRERQAVYWGVEPAKQGPYAGWEQPQARDLTDTDFSRILKAAKGWLRTPVLATNIEGIVRDTQLRAALDLAITTEGYRSTLHPTVYDNLLGRLAGKPQTETLVTVTAGTTKPDEIREAVKAALSSSNTARMMMPKDTVEFKQAQADQFLAGLDRIAATVQAQHQQWGMPFEAAKQLVNAIDKLADEFETTAYGGSSLTMRQAQILDGGKPNKTAEVIQRDTDEKYMDTFKNPHQPIQTEADEPYMAAYKSDDSSGVHNGKSETGRKLAP